jgi:glycosyltransferase involved in cell wall biosynthesis
LDSCLASLQAQTDPPSYELLVAADADSDVEEVVRDRFPDAIVRPGRGHPGAARNVLLHEAQGEWLVFLDDDVVVERHLLRRVDELARAHPDADVLGGPNLTPSGSTRFQIVQGAVLASMVAAGPVRRRYGFHPSGAVDERFFTLCNLAVRREVMLPFPPELVCAEENAVLAELATRGSEMRYDPALAVFHERRDTFAGFARQMRKYGRGRGQLIRRNWRTARVAHFIPSALVAYAVALPLLVTATPAFALGLAAYLLAVAISSTAIATTLRERRLRSWPLAFALTVTLHVCYGWGVIWGLAGRRPAPRTGTGTTLDAPVRATSR